MENNNEYETNSYNTGKEIQALNDAFALQGVINDGHNRAERRNTLIQVLMLGISCAIAWGLGKLERRVSKIENDLNDENTIDISGD